MGDGYYYTLSAIAQSFAAIIALTAIFVVYRLQVFKGYAADIIEKIERLIYLEDMRKRRGLSEVEANCKLNLMTTTEKLFWAKFPDGSDTDVTEMANHLYSNFTALDRLSEGILDWFHITLLVNGITIAISLALLPMRSLVSSAVQFSLLTFVLIWSVVSLLATIHATLTILGRSGFYKFEIVLLSMVRAVGFARYVGRIDSRRTYQMIKAIQKEGGMIELGIYQTKEGKEYDCYFLPGEGVAKAVGPLPEPGQIGARGRAYEVMAKVEQAAKKKIAKEIGPGHWI